MYIEEHLERCEEYQNALRSLSLAKVSHDALDNMSEEKHLMAAKEIVDDLLSRRIFQRP